MLFFSKIPNPYSFCSKINKPMLYLFHALCQAIFMMSIFYALLQSYLPCSFSIIKTLKTLPWDHSNFIIFSLIPYHHFGSLKWEISLVYFRYLLLLNLSFHMTHLVRSMGDRHPRVELWAILGKNHRLRSLKPTEPISTSPCYSTKNTPNMSLVGSGLLLESNQPGEIQNCQGHALQDLYVQFRVTKVTSYRPRCTMFTLRNFL